MSSCAVETLQVKAENILSGQEVQLNPFIELDSNGSDWLENQPAEFIGEVVS